MLTLIGSGTIHLTSNNQYTFTRAWGSSGSNDGQFNTPSGIAVDSSGSVYVSDTGNFRVQKFSNAGTFITKWGPSGINKPSGIAVDSSGSVYVSVGHYIQKFSNDGKFIIGWNISSENSLLAVDSSGSVYTLINVGVQKFSNDGKSVANWGIYNYDYINAIAVDPSGSNFYLLSTYDPRINKFSINQGEFIADWGKSGFDIPVNAPSSVAVDSSGNVYVADHHNNNIQKYDSNGKFTTSIGSPGYDNGQLNEPSALAVDSSGNVYVIDGNGWQNRVQVFTPK